MFFKNQHRRTLDYVMHLHHMQKILILMAASSCLFSMSETHGMTNAYENEGTDIPLNNITPTSPAHYLVSFRDEATKLEFQKALETPLSYRVKDSSFLQEGILAYFDLRFNNLSPKNAGTVLTISNFEILQEGVMTQAKIREDIIIALISHFSPKSIEESGVILFAEAS